MLLHGKRPLVTGALTEKSIAFAAARLAQQPGTVDVPTGFGRGLRMPAVTGEIIQVDGGAHTVARASTGGGTTTTTSPYRRLPATGADR